jgi:acyl-CoA dehydrogenase
MLDLFFDETPFFSTEQRNFAAQVAQYVTHGIGPYLEEATDTEGRFRAALGWLARSDFLRYAVAMPERPLEARVVSLMRDILAYHSPIADLAFVMQGLGTYPIYLAAPDHVRDFWLTRAASGKSIAAFALTEPEAGSDVAAVQTTAQRDGDTYLINGCKRFISNAGIADFYTVFARTGTRPDGKAALSAFVVGARMPGCRVTEQYDMMAPHPIGEVVFENCRVPAEDMVGQEGDGFKLAMQTLDNFRASVGAAACGLARRGLDEALKYAKTRVQFGKPLIEHQLIQSKLAEMSMNLNAARLLVYRAAYLKDSGAEKVTRAASEAKLFATDAAQRIIDDALQIHGGVGLVRGHIVERLYRDVRALRIYEGTSEIQKIVIANQLAQTQ